MLQRLNTKCWSFIGVRLPLSSVFRDSLQDIWWKCETSVKKGHYHIFVSCLFRNTQMSCWRVSRGTSDTWERLLGLSSWFLIWSEELTGTQWTLPRNDRTLPPPPVRRKTSLEHANNTKQCSFSFVWEDFFTVFPISPGVGPDGLWQKDKGPNPPLMLSGRRFPNDSPVWGGRNDITMWR